MSESVYLETLQSATLGLISPLPLEITGSDENFVATWLEGRVEGEGATRDEAVDDCRKALVERFQELRARVASGKPLTDEDDQVWHSLLHFIVEAGRRQMGPGEEYLAASGPHDPDYKGPIYG